MAAVTQGKALAKEVSTVSRSCSQMQDTLAGITASMSSVQNVGATVEGLSAKLDANASGIAAVQATCKQLLSTVRDLQKDTAAGDETRPSCIHASTQTEEPSGAPAAKVHQQGSSGGDGAPHQCCLDMQAAGVQEPSTAAWQIKEPDQPQKVGRLTAMFRGQKPCKPPPGNDAHMQQSGPPAKPRGLQDVSGAQHASRDSRPSAGKQAHHALAEAPLRAVQVGPDAHPRWRRKGGAAANDSGFGSLEPAPMPIQVGAAARKFTAAANPAGKAAMRPDKEQSLAAAGQPADAPTTSSLHLTLQLPRDVSATADTPDKRQSPPPPQPRGSALSGSMPRKAVAEGPEHAAAAPGPRTAAGAKQRTQAKEEVPYTRRAATARQTQPTASAAAMDDDPFAALFARAADTGDNNTKEGSSSASCEAGQLVIDQEQIEREVKMHLKRMRASRQKRAREE